MGVGDAALLPLVGYDKFLKRCVGGATAAFLDADALDRAPAYWFENRDRVGADNAALSMRAAVRSMLCAG